MTALNVQKRSALSAFKMIMMIAVIIFGILIAGTFTFFADIFFNYSIIHQLVKIPVDCGFTDSISLTFKMFCDFISHYMMIFIFSKIT